MSFLTLVLQAMLGTALQGECLDYRTCYQNDANLHEVAVVMIFKRISAYEFGSASPCQERSNVLF